MITATLISEHVQRALDEDIGSGDITAELIAPDQHASATITTRENGVLCGTAFATEAFRQVDPTCRLDWAMQDGDSLNAGEQLCHIHGPARALLTAERTALNFLQLLSGTATAAKRYADRVSHCLLYTSPSPRD